MSFFFNINLNMQLKDLQVALSVAQQGSITGAATRMDMRTATASAALKRVEADLGTTLFIRSTRKLRLSPAGERFLPQLEEAMQKLEQARRSLREDQDEIEGELRVAVSSDLGRNLLIPWLDEFMDEHPALRLRVNISDSSIDFYRDAVDVALRYGSPASSSLYGHKICDVPKLLCAAPAYLEQHGQPQHPDELATHNGLFYQLFDITHDNWSFSRAGEDFTIRMRGDRAANDGDLVRRWCVAGHGVAVKSCLDVAADLLAGHLLPVIPEFRPEPSELWLVFPSRQSITPAARLLRDRLTDNCDRILAQLAQARLI